MALRCSLRATIVLALVWSASTLKFGQAGEDVTTFVPRPKGGSASQERRGDQTSLHLQNEGSAPYAGALAKNQEARLEQRSGEATRLASTEYGEQQDRGAPTRLGGAEAARLGSECRWFRQWLGLLAMSMAAATTVAATTALAVGELRAARREALLAYAEDECQSKQVADPANRGDLIHVAGGKAVAESPVQVQPFIGASLSNCLRVRTTIEVFQWVQLRGRSVTADGNHNGLPCYYTQRWDSRLHDTKGFREKRFTNHFPVVPGVVEVCCGRVMYKMPRAGEVFCFPEELITEFNDFRNAAEKFPSDAVLRTSSGLELKRMGEWHFCSTAEEPQIGDVRVSIEYVPDGAEATIVALQAQAGGFETFLPYCPIQRGWCGTSHTSRRTKLLLAGRRVQSEEDVPIAMDVSPKTSLPSAPTRWLSRFIAPPEIFEVFLGPAISQSECFKLIRCKDRWTKNVYRLSCWATLLTSLSGFSKAVLLAQGPMAIPFGVAWGAHSWNSWEAKVACLTASMVIALLAASVSNLMHRPVTSLACIALATSVVFRPAFFPL